MVTVGVGVVVVEVTLPPGSVETVVEGLVVVVVVVFGTHAAAMQVPPGHGPSAGSQRMVQQLPASPFDAPRSHPSPASSVPLPHKQ